MKTKSTLVAIMFFVCTNLSVTAFAQAVNVQDSLALVALYNSTNGPGWRHHGGWLKEPVENWYGIIVKNNRVTTIRLLDNELTGTIPSTIKNLGYLETLNLCDNHLTGTIPSQKEYLGNLKILNLSGNQLSGNIPKGLATAPLHILDLSANQLSGLIPSKLGNSVHGSSVLFDLSDNQLSGSIPTALARIRGIDIIFNLSGNQLSGNIPRKLAFMGSTRERSHPSLSINLSHNALSGTIPDEFGFRHKNFIGKLDLSFNSLGGEIPSSLSKLSRLDVLHLNNNRLTGRVPASLAKHSYVELWLQDNALTFEGMELIASNFADAVYTPQANIPLHQNSNSLFVSAGGTLSNNTYNWYKLGNPNPTTIAGDSLFNPSSSGKYYAAVTNSICTQLTLNTDTIDYDATLPVTLINLKAQQLGGIIKVDWSSLTEINMERYEVQRSANANGFSSIGSIAAKGNGTAQQNYSFNDLQPLIGNNYYRLKAIDKDGSITYSKIVLVNISGDKTFTIVYPVPAKNILHIQTNGSATFSLINQAGKILLTTNINGNGSMNVGGFAAGLYYLKNNSSGAVQKVVITK